MTTDHDLLRPVRHALSGLEMNTPIDSIIGTARARQRRRRLATGVLTTGAGVTAVVVGTSAIGSTPAAPRTQPAPPESTVHTRLAAFTVSNGANGSTDLSMSKGANVDPDALREALAQHGIPAVVTEGTFCRTPSAQVDTSQILDTQQQADGTTDLTIKPDAFPPGTELSIGLDANTVRFLLISASAPQQCESLTSQPANQQPDDNTAVHNTNNP